MLHDDVSLFVVINSVVCSSVEAAAAAAPPKKKQDSTPAPTKKKKKTPAGSQGDVEMADIEWRDDGMTPSLRGVVQRRTFQLNGRVCVWTELWSTTECLIWVRTQTDVNSSAPVRVRQGVFLWKDAGRMQRLWVTGTYGRPRTPGKLKILILNQSAGSVTIS